MWSEGPFDSTFINNSVALCGSDGEISDLEGSDKVFVYDNEPRNKEIVDRELNDVLNEENESSSGPPTSGTKT